MARLGQLVGKWKTYYTAEFSLLSQNVANNNSLIQLTSILSTENTTTISSDNSTFKLDGTTVYSGYYSKSGAGTVFTKTKNITVAHNSNGSFPVRNVSFSAVDGYIFNPGQSGSGNIIGIPTIPRASGVSCSSPYIGDVAIITIDKKVANFTSTVTYHIKDYSTLTGTLADKTKETVLSFNTDSLKEQIYALMPNAKSIAGTIRCRTYNGNTKIGDTTVANFNLYAKEDDCKPEITGTVVDTNSATIAITGDSSKLIKYVSKPKVTISATSKNSATINDYLINLNDGQTSDLQEHTFDTINSNSITINAVDSRGYDNPKNIELDILDYIKLQINKIDLQRTEDTSNEIILNLNGVWFNNNFNENTLNTLSMNYQYKESNATEWIEGGVLTPTIDGNTFKITNLSLGNIYDYEKEYQFKITASDLLMTEVYDDVSTMTVHKGQEVWAETEDGLFVYGHLWLNDKEIGKKEIMTAILTSNTTINSGGSWVGVTVPLNSAVIFNQNNLEFDSTNHRIIFKRDCKIKLSGNLDANTSTFRTGYIGYLIQLYTSNGNWKQTFESPHSQSTTTGIYVGMAITPTIFEVKAGEYLFFNVTFQFAGQGLIAQGDSTNYKTFMTVEVME